MPPKGYLQRYPGREVAEKNESSELPVETSIVVVPQEGSKPIMHAINSLRDKFRADRV